MLSTQEENYKLFSRESGGSLIVNIQMILQRRTEDCMASVRTILGIAIAAAAPAGTFRVFAVESSRGRGKFRVERGDVFVGRTVDAFVMICARGPY